MEVLLEALFTPLPVYSTSQSDPAAASNLELASSRTSAEEAIQHPDRQIRIASQLHEAAHGEGSLAYGRTAALPS